MKINLHLGHLSCLVDLRISLLTFKNLPGLPVVFVGPIVSPAPTGMENDVMHHLLQDLADGFSVLSESFVSCLSNVSFVSLFMTFLESRACFLVCPAERALFFVSHSAQYLLFGFPVWLIHPMVLQGVFVVLQTRE